MTHTPLTTPEQVRAALNGRGHVQWRCHGGTWMTSSLDADTCDAQIVHCLQYGDFRAELPEPKS